MSEFKKYGPIMVLNVPDGLERFDMKGTYLGIATAGSKKGWHVIEINTVRVHYEIEKLMDFEKYWDIFNGRIDEKLPAEASGVPWCLSGDYKGSY